MSCCYTYYSNLTVTQSHPPLTYRMFKLIILLLKLIHNNKYIRNHFMRLHYTLRSLRFTPTGGLNQNFYEISYFSGPGWGTGLAEALGVSEMRTEAIFISFGMTSWDATVRGTRSSKRKHYYLHIMFGLRHALFLPLNFWLVFIFGSLIFLSILGFWVTGAFLMFSTLLAASRNTNLPFMSLLKSGLRL